MLLSKLISGTGLRHLP